MANKNVIYGINGPVVTVKDTRDFSMMEMVYVSDERLVGEVIGITDKLTTIQVYEETTGLKLGDPIYGTGEPMNILLGPGIIDNIFDGIERPLKAIEESTGSSFISRGAAVSSLDDKKQWDVTITAKVGDYLKAGQIYATCPETPIIEHRCILSPKIKGGKVIKVEPNGKYKINDTVVTIEDDEGIKHELTLCQAWPIRTPRPSAERLSADVPLITGQRVIDTLFPISKGGTAAIIGKKEYLDIIRAQSQVNLGATISPMNAWLIMRGSVTLPLRMKKHNENAQAVAEYLESLPCTSFVAYPGLKSSKYYELAKKQMPNGCGGVFSFGLKADHDTINKFISELKMIVSAVSLGHEGSLIVFLGEDDERQYLYPEEFHNGFMRFSVGLEDAEDIIADLDQALRKSGILK